MFIFKNHAENETGRLVPDISLFFRKALYEVKASGQKPQFQYILVALNFDIQSKKTYETSDYPEIAQF